MKNILFLSFVFLLSCNRNIPYKHIYVLKDTINSSYSVSNSIKNYIPNNSDIIEFNNFLKRKIVNEYPFYSKKSNVRLKKGKFYQYSGYINSENDTVIILNIVYKNNSKDYDFNKFNYTWYNTNPFSRKKRNSFVIEYNKSNKSVPKILEPSNYPRSAKSSN